MILTSITESVPFTPPWRENDPKAPIFHLRAGSVIERGQMEAEIAGFYRAGVVQGYELRAAVRSGIATLMADDPDHEQLFALFEAELEHEIEKVRAEAAGSEVPGDPMSPTERRELAQVRAILAEHWPEFRDLAAQMERRRQIAPIVALRRFCTGIEAEGVVYTNGRDGLVSEATLAALDPTEMMIAGARAFSLQYGAGEDEAKNSSRPSLSDEGQKSSGSAAPSKGAGKSKGNGGARTPA